MTISKVYIEFHKITSFVCPWKVLGGPWEVLGGALGGPWGVVGGSLGVLGGPRGLLGIFVNSTRKMTQRSYVGPSNDDGKTNEILTIS